MHLLHLGLALKGLSHVTVNKTVISIINIVANTCPLCSAPILVDRVNPLESYFQKSTNIACNRTTYKCFVCFSTFQNNTFILRKVVENLCDMTYQKYCKIVVLKDSRLLYVTQLF